MDADGGRSRAADFNVGLCLFGPFSQLEVTVITFLTQNAAVYSTRVHALGRYVFILHYHQPHHPTYPVQVYINGGRIWQGKSRTNF